MSLLSTLTDNFSASAIDSAKWSLSTLNSYTFSGSVAAASSQLKVVLAANVQAYCGVASSNSYSADIAYARLVQAPNNAVGVVADMQIHKPGFRTAAQIAADTSLSSEESIIGNYTGWQRFPVITTWAPRGDSIASWWTGPRPTWLMELNTWFTLYEAVSNTAVNSRVEIKNLRAYIYGQSAVSAGNFSGAWTLWDFRDNFSASSSVGDWHFPFDGGGAVSAGAKKAEPSGGTSFRPVYDHFYHGYGNNPLVFSNTAAAADVRGVLVAMDFRLVLNDSASVDDRANAHYVVDVGADYYPDATMMAGWAPFTFAPGVGNGRYLKAASQWKTATMWVVNTNAGYSATVGEIAAHPPPLEAHTAGSCAFWSYENNKIYAYGRHDGYEQLKWSASYDSVAHTWFRIKNDGTTVYFDTAPTSANDPPGTVDWVTRASMPLPWESDSTKVFLGGGTYSVNAAPGTLIWDGFNTAAGAAPAGTASTSTSTPPAPSPTNSFCFSPIMI